MIRLKRKPEWLKKKIDFDKSQQTATLLNSLGVHTVCKEAKCPNIGECFRNKHATFLILGKYCTRRCLFCNVEKTRPLELDTKEPHKVASAVKELQLKHAVITSVTRDDLKDGGASIFAQTVQEIKKISQKISIELLIPDFKADQNALKTVCASNPDIIGHNLETIHRLYHLRPQANYQKSLGVLKFIKDIDKDIYTKSALMLGLGETENEVIETMRDLRQYECDFLSLGQYLRPSLKHVEVAEYIKPEQFEHYKTIALKLGFKHAESAPYARSSYHAQKYLE
ncbi:MAG: lipoyl synthase [Candidatus Omnitrophota bacterium]